MGFFDWVSQTWKTYRTPPTPTIQETQEVGERAERMAGEFEARGEPVPLGSAELGKRYGGGYVSTGRAVTPTPTGTLTTEGVSVETGKPVKTISEREAMAIGGQTISKQVGDSAISPYQTYYGSYVGDKPTWKERFVGTYHSLINEPAYVGEPTIGGWRIKSDISGKEFPLLPYQTKGTIVTDQPILTYGEVAEREKLAVGGYDPAEFRLQDIAKKISVSYETKLGEEVEALQPFISEGKISYEAGVEALKLKGESFQPLMQKEYEIKADKYLMERSLGTSFKTDVEFAPLLPLKVGATIGGLIVAPVPVGTYLGISGAKETYLGFGKGILGEDLTWKERGLAFGRGGLGLVSVGIGGKVSFGAIEKGIVAGELKELSQQPIKFEALKFKSPKFDYDIVYGKQTLGGLKTEYILKGKTFVKDTGGFIMPTGEGQAITSGTLGWNILSGRMGTQITSLKGFEVGAKGLSFQLGKTGKYFGTLGKGVMIPKTSIGALWTEKTGLWRMPKRFAKSLELGGEAKIDYYGGVAKKVKDDLFYIRSGKIKEWTIDVYPKTGKIKQAIDINLRDVGRLKVIDISKFDKSGVRFITTTGKKSSKQYLKSLYQPSFGATTISKQIIKQIAPTTTSPVITSLKAPSMKSILTGATISGVRFKPPKVRTDTFLGAMEGYGIKTGLLEKQKQKFYAPTKKIQRAILTPISKIKLKTGLAQIQPSKTKLKTALKTKMKLGLISMPTISTITTPSFKLGGWGIVPPPIFRGMDKRRKRKPKKRKARKPTRKTRYMPTIKAKYFKETAFKIPRAYKFGFSLGRRPQIVRRKRRRIAIRKKPIRRTSKRRKKK